MQHLPEEVLCQIAQRLDLPSQVSLACSDKHINGILQGNVQYVRGWNVDRIDSYTREQAEAFALNGIDLLPELPFYIHGEVAVLYEALTQAEIAAITYTKGKFRHQVISYHVNSAAKDSDEEEDLVYGHTELQRGDQVLFVQFGTKQMSHRILSNAPFGNREYELDAFDARVLLKTEKGAGCMNHCRAAQFCFDLMCRMSNGHAGMYIRFSQLDITFSVIPCIMIRRTTRSDGQVEWLVDEQVVQSPVKMDFERFPQAAVQVQAHFTCELAGFAPPRPTMVPATQSHVVHAEVLEQGLSFIYNKNLNALSLNNLYRKLAKFHSHDDD